MTLFQCWRERCCYCTSREDKFSSIRFCHTRLGCCRRCAIAYHHRCNPLEGNTA